MIYLDNAATTKPSESAIKMAEKFNKEYFFNPSALYEGGLFCAKEIKRTKELILKNIGSVSHEVIFTSCGSESDNMAIFCAVKRGNVATSLGEHAAVYNSFLELKQRQRQVFFAKLNNDGSVNVDDLIKIVKGNAIDFVSVVHVNNETGAINDINFIAKELKKINPKLIFHSDGVQAFGKIPYRISNEIDLYSISAHKINALKGLGVLLKNKSVRISPLIYGGGQENNLRSGTENVFGIKVFEYAMQEKYALINEYFEKINKYNLWARNNLDKDIFTIISSNNCSPYVLSVSAVGVKGEIIMHMLEKEGVIIGNGSACSSKHKHSRVLKECGFADKVLDGAIRISFSCDTTFEEVEFAINKLNENAKKLKGIIN